jgi:hypothetical protein
MTSLKSDFWSSLLWENYLPLISSGAPFYLAADRNLIHEWTRKYYSAISINEALDAFHDACLSLMERTSTKVTLEDNVFNKVPGTTYSRAICLAVQQVLVVETMLAHEQYSERSYFPRYRDLLKIKGGNIHVNPLSGYAFQKIWSTLGYEIASTPGSSDSSITFSAGTGIDVNRNLPMCQALLTRHDLSVLFQQSGSALRLAGADNDAIMKILCNARSYLRNNRAQLLVAKATTELQLSNRLCEQVRSFVAEDHTIALETKHQRSNQTIVLVAFPDPDSWLEDRYCLYKRLADNALSEESPTSSELVSKLGSELCLALVAREDGFEEIGSSNQFEEGDSVLAIVQSTRKEYFSKKFADTYECSPPTDRQSNLPNEFSVVFCGELPHSQFFDPLGRKSKTRTTAALELKGGLLSDGRSQTYLAGYPPTLLSYKGTVLVPKTEVVVNGHKKQLGQFLQSLSVLRQWSRFILELNGEKLEFMISPSARVDKSKYRFGFPLFERELKPTAVALNPHQPSLRGAVFTQEVVELDSAREVSVSGIDLLKLVDKGSRISLPDPQLNALISCIEQSSEHSSLASLALKQISARRTVPCKALQTSVMRSLMQCLEIGKELDDEGI